MEYGGGSRSSLAICQLMQTKVSTTTPPVTRNASHMREDDHRSNRPVATRHRNPTINAIDRRKESQKTCIRPMSSGMSARESMPAGTRNRMDEMRNSLISVAILGSSHDLFKTGQEA